MRELLMRRKRRGKMTEIYTDPEDPEVFHVSYILDVTEDSILECCVGVHGEFDGYAAEYIRDVWQAEGETVISLSDIRRILVGDVETRELDYLYHYKD